MNRTNSNSPAHVIGMQLSGLMANIAEKIEERENMTKRFTLSDFVCPCCNRLRTSPRLYDHAKMLDELQELLGFPIEIVRAYLCSKMIKTLGMNPNTYHALLATDVKPKEIVTGREMLTLFMAAREVGFTGVILHDDHVHLDLRKEPLYRKV